MPNSKIGNILNAMIGVPKMGKPTNIKGASPKGTPGAMKKAAVKAAGPKKKKKANTAWSSQNKGC